MPLADAAYDLELLTKGAGTMDAATTTRALLPIALIAVALSAGTSANTDTDSVTIFGVRQNGRLARLKELKVGDEPRSVTTLLNKALAYVANSVSGTVSVVDLAFSKSSGRSTWAPSRRRSSHRRTARPATVGFYAEGAVPVAGSV